MCAACVINHSTAYLSQADQTIFYQRWVPDLAPVGIVLLVHGLAEHSSRYTEFASQLVDNGYAVFGFDLLGHGHSSGEHAHVNSFEQHLRAINGIHQLIIDSYPQKPHFLLGHSMGGLLASAYLIQQAGRLPGFSAAVLSGAALQTPLQPPAIQMLLIKLLARWFPALGVVQLEASGVSRDNKVVQHYIDDVLVYSGKISAAVAVEMFNTMEQVHQHAGCIECPMLILHGGADTITSPAGSQRLFKAINSDDKQLKIYPGLYHEILNEPERDEVYDDIISWLNKYL